MTAESQSGTPPARRLVVRIKIPKGTPPAPVERRLNRGALLLTLVAAAGLLIWVGVSLLRTDPAPAPAATVTVPTPAPSEAAPVITEEPVPEPAAEAVEARSAKVEPPARPRADAPPSPVKEVIPNVPRSARETIRGTIRVSIRVILDKEGAVLAATADEPGPSRYFERLSVEAAKKWIFTPADRGEQRVMLVRFYFKRSGTSARASSLQ